MKYLVDSLISAVNANVSVTWEFQGVKYQLIFISIIDMEDELAGKGEAKHCKGGEVISLEMIGFPPRHVFEDLTAALESRGWKKSECFIREERHRKYFFVPS